MAGESSENTGMCVQLSMQVSTVQTSRRWLLASQMMAQILSYNNYMRLLGAALALR